MNVSWHFYISRFSSRLFRTYDKPSCQLRSKHQWRIYERTGIIPRSAFSMPSIIRILPCFTALTAGLSTYARFPPTRISRPYVDISEFQCSDEKKGDRPAWAQFLLHLDAEQCIHIPHWWHWMHKWHETISFRGTNLANVSASLLAYGPGCETKNISCPSRYFWSMKCKLSELTPSWGSRRRELRVNLLGTSAAGTSYVMSPSFNVPMVGGVGLNSFRIWFKRRWGAMVTGNGLIVRLSWSNEPLSRPQVKLRGRRIVGIYGTYV